VSHTETEASHRYDFSLFQLFENLSVDLIHIKGLESRKGSFHPEKRNNRFLDSINGHDEITFSGLFFIDFHKSSIPHRLGDFVGSSLECTSRLAGFDGHNGFLGRTFFLSDRWFVGGTLFGR